MPDHRRLPRSTPEDEGVSSHAILALMDELEASSPELHSLMVLRHGTVVAEGGGRRSPRTASTGCSR